jgi:type IV secretion system protein TrbL
VPRWARPAAVAVGAAATGVGGAVAAGARMAPAAAKLAGSGARAATAASSAKSAFQAGSASAGGGLKARRWRGQCRQDRRAGGRAEGPALAEGACRRCLPAGRPAARRVPPGAAGEAAAPRNQPAWAKRLHRRQQLTHAATTAAHTLRGGDGGSSSQGPSLRDSD